MSGSCKSPRPRVHAPPPQKSIETMHTTIAMQASNVWIGSQWRSGEGVTQKLTPQSRVVSKVGLQIWPTRSPASYHLTSTAHTHQCCGHRHCHACLVLPEFLLRHCCFVCYLPPCGSLLGCRSTTCVTCPLYLEISCRSTTCLTCPLYLEIFRERRRSRQSCAAPRELPARPRAACAHGS